jgi:DNA-binding transcriptional MerR regulator
VSNYSIKDLEQLSGIKAHTLRIWEQRYSFIEPKRTETNIRYYSDDDLKLVLNISTLKENGHRISNIAKMSEEEMAKEVMRVAENNLRYPDQINSLTLSMIDMDEDRFEKILSTNILKNGFERTMLNIIYPFLSKIGMLWQTGTINPAQEHFISNLIRQKLTVAIDGQYVTDAESKAKWVLFLPEGELHELSLMFSSYLLRSRKFKVVYLGQTLPKDDLRLVYDLHKPDYLLTYCTTLPKKSEVQDYVDYLSKNFPESTVFVAGYQIIGQDVQAPDNVKLIYKVEDLIGYLDSF